MLATNVAETSLTVPGIKYVVDPGTARISRYSHRLKVQRLPIEPVSQASANQRKGRCGRTSDGICIRLYSEEDFDARPEFTDPEILRTNLASVILQMTALGPRRRRRVPVRRPAGPAQRHRRRRPAAGARRARPSGAGKLTPLGRQLAQLPVDPRLARMVLEADRNGCVARGAGDRRRAVHPGPARAAGRQAAGRPTSCTPGSPTRSRTSSAYLNLWRYLQEQQQELSGSQFRRLCKRGVPALPAGPRVAGPLRAAAAGRPDARASRSSDRAEPTPQQRAHRRCSPGCCRTSALQGRPTSSEYLGARGAQFAIFPGSALFKKPPRWVMAAELVETSRLWARVDARIEPEWVEPLAAHLVKRSYSEPHWEKKQGAVMAYEQVTLYGLPIVAAPQGRTTAGSTRSCPASCSSGTRWSRATGRPTTRSSHDNRELLDEVEELEHRARRRDILVDDETLFDFYDAADPRRRRLRRGTSTPGGRRPAATEPDLLTFDPAMLVNDGAATRSTADDYPDAWQPGRLALPLTYQFEPGTTADGVTVARPARRAQPGRRRTDFDWQVPGLREELVTALIRSLPKALRRNFVPGAGLRRARCSTAVTARPRSRCSTRWSRELRAADRRRRSRATPGTSTRCPTTCG